ncbi:MAG: enamine deaminase RidA [Pseudomonadota bacterium]|nr:RidA family protein [Rubrivivax sp.]NLZ41061.1 RidA family protein [Comamonadaceae bacterium]
MPVLPFRTCNPVELGQPLGSYAQVLEVPAGADLVFLSGQTPIRADGSIPTDFDEQAEVVWRRIEAALAAVGLECRHICRVVTYLLDSADAPRHARIRARYLGDARPASTGVVVQQLFNPAYRLEVEVTAARPPAAGAGDR